MLADAVVSLLYSLFTLLTQQVHVKICLREGNSLKSSNVYFFILLDHCGLEKGFAGLIPGWVV